MGSVVISGATSGAITLAVPAEAGTHTVTIPAATGQLLNSGDLSSAGDTAAGNAAAVGYTAAEGLILTGQGSTSDVTIKNDADATVLSIPTGTSNVGIGTTAPSTYGKFVVSGSSNSGVGAFIGNASLTGSAPTYQGSIRLIDNPTSSTTTSGGIEFLTSTFGSGYGWKMAAIDSSGVQLTFATRQNSAAWTERMRIDASGNVGIGSANALDNLHVFDTTDSAITTQLLLQNQGAGSHTAGIAFQVSSSGEVASTTYAPKAGILFERTTANGRGPMKFMLDNAADNNAFAAGDEVMRITPAGDIGIGTTAPNGKVQISSAALGTTATNSQVLLRLFSPDISNTTTYRFYNYRFADGSSHSSSEMRYGRHVDATEQGYVGLRDGAVTFGYGTTEKARISSNTLFLGTTTNTANTTLVVQGNNGVNSCIGTQTDHAGANAAMYFINSNGIVGSIVTASSATAFNTSSDYRLKENVDYSWDATTRLKQLKPARFNFIADADKTVDGFLAHEVSSIVPEAIVGEKDGMRPEVLYVEGDELPDGKSVGDVKEASAPDYQGIDQSKLVPLLVKTIQELEARITALEA
jgi:hypothetical protein